MIGGVGGLVTGAIAGSAAGLPGAVVGAVIGGAVGAAASGVAVAAVNRIDDDSTITGFPDDMTIETNPEDREPMVLDRRTMKSPPSDPTADLADPAATYPPIGTGTDSAANWAGPTASTPIGFGLQEAAALTDPANEPIDRGGVTGDAQVAGTAKYSKLKPTDEGWERDNDAHTIDVNPDGTEHIRE